MQKSPDTERTLGLFAATGVGVGAIVGGGILALAGVAFATTGPAAIVAFSVNGLIALLTALSFAEMASKFPESGGTYTFAKKVLSVESAFTVGWVVWFASIVASVLYAVGFAHFGVAIVADIWTLIAGETPPWLLDHRTVTGAAIGTTVLLALALMRKAGGGGQWINVGKVAVFAVLIAGGLWVLTRRSMGDIGANLQPFFTAGFAGVVQAMGYTFIALQGFDLIAAVGGEVRQPARTIPRAMMFSLAIALAIYIPLLFVITTVGVPAGQSISEAAGKDPERIVAFAARNFLGPFGYWLVMVAAVLSMISALQANLFAASRIARAMARDRTLPSPLSALNIKRGTPVVAVAVTALIVVVLLVVLPDVAAAGAASSLIFLITFALAHWVAILVRQRSARRPPPFRSPLFPAVPIIGGLSCLGLAVFQGVAEPVAGLIAVTWLGIGAILFLTLFARRARLQDAASTALDPELVTLRGRTPMVLVPIANPNSAEGMVALANSLVPQDIGRVVLMTVVVPPPEWQPDDDNEPIESSQRVLGKLLRATTRLGVPTETLITVAAKPMEEIARVAKLHHCESLLLGLSEISESSQGTPLEWLLDTIDGDIVVLRSRDDLRISQIKRILVPVGGRGGHDHLRARLLGSLMRTSEREVTFLRVLPAGATSQEQRRAKVDLVQFAHDEARGQYKAEVICSDNAASDVAGLAAGYDLVVLGIARVGKRKKLFGNFTRHIASNTTCPLIVISRRG